MAALVRFVVSLQVQGYTAPSFILTLSIIQGVIGLWL